MYLQLAESPPAYSVRSRRRRPSRGLSDCENYYIYIPEQRMFIREDMIDAMNPAQWREFLISVAPYQQEVQNGMSENAYLASKATRKAKREERKEKRADKKEAKAEKKATKSARKEEKKQTRVEKKKSRVEKRRSKSDARKIRAEAKRTKAENADPDEETALDKITGAAKNIFGAVTGGGGGGGDYEEEYDETEDTEDTGGGSGGSGGKTKKGDTSVPFYKNPWIIGGTAVGVGLLVYAVTRKK
jgi:hypothetical protein